MAPLGRLKASVGPHMTDASGRKSWIRAALLIGVVYFLIGRGFALPADQLGVWRLAAWVASAAFAAAHIGYEYFRLNNSPRATALHAATAVAFGAFALALAANIHDLGSDSGYRPRMHCLGSLARSDRCASVYCCTCCSCRAGPPSNEAFPRVGCVLVW